MINQNTFENLIITNTIVAVFCIILLVTFIVFIILFLIPSVRCRLLGHKQKNEIEIDDISSFGHHPSFYNFTLGTSRFNPLFEPTPDSTTMTTTQFGALFHPRASTATLLHPTIWTSTIPVSTVSNEKAPTSTITTQTLEPPPLPVHPPTIASMEQRSPRIR